MSENYKRMAEFGRKLFLEWDQKAMIDRLKLKYDADYICIRYMGNDYRIERATGTVFGTPDATPMQILTIYDFICRKDPLPVFRGSWRGTNDVRGVPSSSPNGTELQTEQAYVLEKYIPEIKRIFAAHGFKPFPQGDAACIIPVFDRMEAVFQLWTGDEEFPPQIRFLWDEYALSYLRFETLFYVMHDFLDLLQNEIATA